LKAKKINLKEDKFLEVLAWRIWDSEGKPTYQLQANDVPEESKAQLLQDLNDWRQVGIGRCEKNNFIILFSKTFDDVDSWLAWAKEFPYELKETRE